jgi:hypothetical protein
MFQLAKHSIFSQMGNNLIVVLFAFRIQRTWFYFIHFSHRHNVCSCGQPTALSLQVEVVPFIVPFILLIRTVSTYRFLTYGSVHNIQSVLGLPNTG